MLTKRVLKCAEGIGKARRGEEDYGGGEEGKREKLFLPFIRPFSISEGEGWKSGWSSLPASRTDRVAD